MRHFPTSVGCVKLSTFVDSVIVLRLVTDYTLCIRPPKFYWLQRVENVILPFVAALQYSSQRGCWPQSELFQNELVGADYTLARM